MPLIRPKAADPGQLVAWLERRLEAECAERGRLADLLAKAEVQALGSDAADGPLFSARLEELIGRRTKALAAARDEAVAASRSKSSFLASMSHEIRTPLTSIIGFAELILDGRVPVADKTDAARTIVRNGRHLLEVINDILDLSKIESNLLSLESIEVPLPKLLDDIESLATDQALAKSLHFTVTHHLPLPPLLRSDPVRLKQILLNFCSNAIKFSTEGEVRLDIRYDAAACEARFDVSDTGIGMMAEEVERLFKPFAQADVSTTRKFGGTGLGLYISKQLADLLGGRIDVRSTPGLGSCFSLTVPTGMVFAPGELLAVRREQGGAPRPNFKITTVDVPSLRGRVLVAEDGLDNQRLIASYLRLAGVDFDIVGDGALAVERATDQDYAMILMDIQMPVMDGVRATQRLRAANRRLPIVAITANVMHDDVMRYRAAGCDDVLAKPIQRAQFYAVLERYLDLGPLEPGASTGDYEIEFAGLRADFIAGLPTTFDAIDAAAAAGQGAVLLRLLHALKGTAGSYGCAAISAMAAHAEGEARSGRFAAARTECRRMQAAFDDGL